MELVEKEQAFTPYIENQVDRLIKKAARPEELLELLGGSHHLDNNHAALVLIRLSHLLSEKPKDKALLIQDARFQQLLCLLNSQINLVWHGTLSRLLRSLYALGLPRTSKELQSVEQEVRWRMRKLKYKHLAFLADSCATLSQEQHSQELLTELLMHLERRWTEIEDGRTLVTIMMKVGHLSEPLMNRLEDKVLGLKAGGTQPASPRLWTCSLGDSCLQRGPLCALGSEPRELLSGASGITWGRTGGLGAATGDCPVAAFIKHHLLLPTQALP